MRFYARTSERTGISLPFILAAPFLLIYAVVMIALWMIMAVYVALTTLAEAGSRWIEQHQAAE